MGNATESLIYVLLFFVGAYLVVVLIMEGVKRIRSSLAGRRRRRGEKCQQAQLQLKNKTDLPSAQKEADQSKQEGSL